MRSEEEKKEQRKKAQKKYYEKNKDYYRKQSLNEAKRVRKERNLYKEIIKEARKYIKSTSGNFWIATSVKKELLEILDKGSEKE